MAKIERELVKDSEVIDKVLTYVRDKYKDLKNLDLLIKENDKLYYVYKHINGAPLILNKSSF